MGNIGSEVYRAIKWFKLNDDRFQTSFEMALELFDLTIKDNRWDDDRIEVIHYRNLFYNILINLDQIENADSKINLLNDKFNVYGLAANEERYKLSKNIP